MEYCPGYMISYGDLFSGIGCVAQALTSLNINFDYKFACDIDHHCRANLKENFKIGTLYHDVKDITSLPHVDLFTAGFPCQAFSSANKTNGGQGHKSYDLFTDTIRCLKLCTPNVFILENVAGLTSKRNKDYFGYIKDTLDGLQAYQWQHRVLNSKDYGTPQSRNRVYFIGKLKASPPPLYPICESIKIPLINILDLSLPMTDYETGSVPCMKKLMVIDENALYIDNCQSGGGFIVLHKLNNYDWGSCLIASRPPRLYQRTCNSIISRTLTTDELRQIQGIIPSFKNICSESQFSRQIGNGMDVAMMAKLIALNI